MSKVIVGLPGPWADDYRQPSQKSVDFLCRVLRVQQLDEAKELCNATPEVVPSKPFVQKFDEAKELCNASPEVVPSKPLSASGSKMSWWDWLNDDENDDVDLEEFGKALSEAGSLASRSKKPQSNQHSKPVVKPSPLSPETGVVDADMPGVIVLCNLCRYYCSNSLGHLIIIFS